NRRAASSTSAAVGNATGASTALIAADGSAALAWQASPVGVARTPGPAHWTSNRIGPRRGPALCELFPDRNSDSFVPPRDRDRRAIHRRAAARIREYSARPFDENPDRTGIYRVSPQMRAAPGQYKDAW